MKNRRGVLGILFVTGLILCWGTKVYASTEWAGLTATLSADQTSITRTGVDPFQAISMYAETKNVSAYSIMFITRGGNEPDSITYTEASITVRPGNSNTVSIDSRRNYHSLSLTGMNGLNPVKGCIGYGYVEKN